MQYRGDIDGLRAVAVLAVMAFHAGLGMTGGYVGVDVFFVISGFLITSIIIKDLERGSFSLTRFWDRRIRRIWPAATVVTAATLLVALGLMLPVSLELTAKDAIAQLLMLANVRYWAAVDYFAGAAELRPLLHTWSLAVEEQFYLLFPPLLMALWRLPSRHRARFLVALALLSLALSVWALDSFAAANFYLLPFRAWELLLGGILAVRGVPRDIPRAAKEVAAWSGFAMIAASVLLYDDQTPFPALAAIPPCLGSALIIATPGSSLSRALQVRPLVAVGKMSYSLYLWHWPALAFLRYLHGVELPAEVAIAALVLSGALAWASWRWVETPFRHIETGSWLTTVLLGVAASAAVGALAFWVVQAEGFPSRFDADVVEFSNPDEVPRRWVAKLPAHLHNRAELEDANVVLPMGAAAASDEEERPDFLLWGDSHAMAVSALVDSRASHLGLRGFAALRSGTRPMPGAVRPAAPRGRDLWNDAVLEWVAARRPRVILLCARWSLDLEGLPDGSLETLIAPRGSPRASRESAREATQAGLLEIVDAAESADARVFFFVEVPYQGRGPEELAVASLWANEPLPRWGTSLAEHERRQTSLRHVLETFRPDDLRVVDLGAATMGENGRTRVRVGAQSLYWDDDHLSPVGAELLLSDLITEAMLSASEAH